jgi:hypothetical protein
MIEKINPEWKDLSKDLHKNLNSIEKIDLLFGAGKKLNI